LGALSPKIERLKTTTEPKIIVVGGSSVAFGLDSALLSEYTGYEVVNFGLYATLGTRVMLDLSRDYVKDGDVVVLAPELDPQTLSLYFNGEAVWQAADSDLSILGGVHSDNYADLVSTLPGYLAAVLPRVLKSEGKISPDGIYRKDSFNEYGDIVYPREYNIMTAGYDVNQTVTLSKDLYDPEFVSYLNEYIADAQEKGAKVCYTFCPVNRSALADGTGEEEIATFYRDVAEMIDCPVISDPNDLLMDEGYFYDTNFHLNDAGVVVRTANLIDDLKRVLGDTERVTIELPDVPERPVVEGPTTWEENEWSPLFLYEPFGDGLRIIGVTEEAKAKEMLEIPYMAEGKPVLVLAADIFSECKVLKELTVYENVTLMENGVFRGADALTAVHMRRETAEDLEAGADLFDGAPEALRICFYTETSYQNFVSGYWWGVHAARMENLSPAPRG
ncbi:MAG: hypothetical protein J6B77_03075, partial [Clostridia bacterium]|nr:hypothetical protein [Clostridia bacterium]